MRGISKFKPISSRFSWWQYLFSFVLFSALTVLPVLMFGGLDLMLKTGYYAIWFFLYWAAIAFVFCIVTAYQKYQALPAIRPCRSCRRKCWPSCGSRGSRRSQRANGSTRDDNDFERKYL